MGVLKQDRRERARAVHPALRMKTLRWGVFAGGVLGLACATAPAGGAAPDTGWDALASRFVEGTMREHPGRAVNAGRHDFDGQVRDFSRAALEKEAVQLR